MIDSICLFVLVDQFLFHSPGLRPGRRIFDCYGIFDGIGIDPRKALDEMQVFASVHEAEFRRKVSDVDDQRISFPTAARIAEALPYR